MWAARGLRMKSLPARLFSSVAICRRKQSSKASRRAWRVNASHRTPHRCNHKFSNEVFTDGCSKETGQESRQIRQQGREKAWQESCEESGRQEDKGTGASSEATCRERQGRERRTQGDGYQALESGAAEGSFARKRQGTHKACKRLGPNERRAIRPATRRQARTCAKEGSKADTADAGTGA